MALPTLLPKTTTPKKSGDRRSRQFISATDYSPLDKINTEKLIIEHIGLKAFHFIKRHVDLVNGTTALVATTTKFNIDKLPKNKFHNIINLKKVNDIRRINKFFESVNAKIPIGGIYISRTETYVSRKIRILNKSLFPFNWIHYSADVMVKRVFPKVPLTKKVYFWMTKGKNRVLSIAETFGRLYSCGFEIIDEQYINGDLYFVVRKTKQPIFPENPTYGPLITLKRHGKDGKLFNVYKLRTMHAYSEYLQEYVYKKNKLEDGGKFKDDFRVTTEGKFFRKFWLDELPMIINIFKGDMKIVGVRPLSSHYFNLYSEDLKAKRTKSKPGLIPPFYADMPKSLEEIMESEMRYLEAYEKHPHLTDIRYFVKAWANILIKRARSS